VDKGALSYALVRAAVSIGSFAEWTNTGQDAFKMTPDDRMRKQRVPVFAFCFEPLVLQRRTDTRAGEASRDLYETLEVRVVAMFEKAWFRPVAR
jgi:hypothetical protein